jgi:hypothetical protein
VVGGFAAARLVGLALGPSHWAAKIAPVALNPAVTGLPQPVPSVEFTEGYFFITAR